MHETDLMPCDFRRYQNYRNNNQALLNLSSVFLETRLQKWLYFIILRNVMSSIKYKGTNLLAVNKLKAT